MPRATKAASPKKPGKRAIATAIAASAPKSRSKKPAIEPAALPVAGPVAAGAEGPRMVPLGQIVPGREGIDPRTVQDEQGMIELVASIGEHGLIVPLVARPIEVHGLPRYEVVEGNRRLAALRMIHTNVDHLVPVTISSLDDATAREHALAANIIRAPLHPLDQCMAFEAMVSDGKSETEIASHFGLDVRQVRRARALAALHPDVHAAWREGRIQEDQARAFSAGTPERQAALLPTVLEVRDSWRSAPSGIRHELSRSYMSATDRRAVYVGVEAYLEAGGTLLDDLFVETRQLLDPELMERLAEAKLRAEAERIREAEGWGAYRSIADISHPYHPDLTALADDAEREALTSTFYNKAAQDARAAARASILARLMDDPAEKARRMVILGISPDGEALVSRGHVMDEPDEDIDENTHLDDDETSDFDDADADDGAAPRPARGPVVSQPARDTGPTHLASIEPEARRLSRALAEHLADRLGAGLSVALLADPKVALAAAVAGLTTWRAPVRLSGAGWDRTTQSPSVAMATLLDLDTDTLLATAAPIFAGHVHTSIARPDEATPRAAIMDLIARLPAEPAREAIRRAFDPRVYFAGVNAALCREALVEIDGTARGAPAKIADLRAHCVTAAERSTWLPLEMRHPHYIAPQSATAGTVADDDAEAA